MGGEATEKHQIFKLSRRDFVQLTGTAFSGLGIAMAAWPAMGSSHPKTIEARAQKAAHLQAYVAMHNSGRVSIVAPIAEMGQGIFSSLPMLIAEELDLPWELIDIKHSFASEAFINPMARDQYAAESRSIRGMFLHLRRIGARCDKCWSARPPRNGQRRAIRSLQVVDSSRILPVTAASTTQP